MALPNAQIFAVFLRLFIGIWMPTIGKLLGWFDWKMITGKIGASKRQVNPQLRIGKI